MADPELPIEESLYDVPPTTRHYDPEAVAPPPDGSGRDDDQVSVSAEPTAFDPRHTEEFHGLLYLGALMRSFGWLGHRFVVRTMRTDELVRAALAVKPYSGSEAYARAYQAAVVAGCVVSVDDKPLPVVPISDTEDAFEQRVRWVMRHWFPPVLDRIYEEYVSLELTVREVMDDMGKASG